MNKEKMQDIKERLDLFPSNMNEPAQKAYCELFDYIANLEQQVKKQKEVIDKAIKCIDYNTKYRNGADIYQFVDIESEILEPLKFILELDEENGNAYLKEFNDWLKEVE